MATVVFSATVLSFGNPNLNLNPNPKPHLLSLHHANQLRLGPTSKTLTRPPKSLPPLTVSASASPSPASVLSDSTRTISSLAALAFSLSKLLLSKTLTLTGTAGAAAGDTAGTLFFARLRDRPSGHLNTPLTVVAAGMSKWLDIYSGILLVRVLLSWFPNIPWDRQPLSAIRDLCDPYLNLFRNIIPPVFDTLDVSPLLAFAVLGVLSSFLSYSRGVY